MLKLYVANVPDAPGAPTETYVYLDDYSKTNIAIQVSWILPVNNGAVVTGYKLYMA